MIDIMKQNAINIYYNILRLLLPHPYSNLHLPLMQLVYDINKWNIICVHLNIWYPFIFSLFFIISYHTSITSIIFLYFCFFLSKYRWHWVSNKHYWWSITAQSALGYSPNSNCLPHHIHSEIFVRGKDFFGTDRCRGFEFIWDRKSVV